MHGGARAGPDHDPEDRGGEHREQLADEQGVDRYRRGKHLDDLVRFLLDQLGQQHGREQQRQEEQDHWPIWPVMARSFDSEPDVVAVCVTASRGGWRRRGPGVWQHQLELPGGGAVGMDRSGQIRLLRAMPVSTAWIGGLLVASSRFRWAAGSGSGANRTSPTSFASSIASASRSRAVDSASKSAGMATTATTGFSRWLATLAPMPPKMPPNSSGNSGPSRKNRNVLRQDRRGEIAPAR